MYSNCCSSCSFESEIIKIGPSSHKMYGNNILNLKESTTILNAHTKKVWKLIACSLYTLMSMYKPRIPGVCFIWVILSWLGFLPRQYLFSRDEFIARCLKCQEDNVFFVTVIHEFRFVCAPPLTDSLYNDLVSNLTRWEVG